MLVLKPFYIFFFYVEGLVESLKIETNNYHLSLRFSTFKYLRTPKGTLSTFVYPQSNLIYHLRTPLGDPQNQRIVPPKQITKILRTPCDLLAHPRLRTADLRDGNLFNVSLLDRGGRCSVESQTPFIQSYKRLFSAVGHRQLPDRRVTDLDAFAPEVNRRHRPSLKSGETCWLTVARSFSQNDGFGSEWRGQR